MGNAEVQLKNISQSPMVHRYHRVIFHLLSFLIIVMVQEKILAQLAAENCSF